MPLYRHHTHLDGKEVGTEEKQSTGPPISIIGTLLQGMFRGDSIDA